MEIPDVLCRPFLSGEFIVGRDDLNILLWNQGNILRDATSILAEIT
jgi:hypothetical protein